MADKLTKYAQEQSPSEMQKMSRDSASWIMKKISEIGDPNSSVFKENNRFRLGGLFFFHYNAKGAGKLPYYDSFPLVIPLETYGDGFLGLNLHYLPLRYRVAFLDKLMDYAILGPAGEVMSVRISYDILNATRRLKEFKPCIKRYLTGHIRSRMVAVQPDEWKTAIFLPVQNFVGASTSKVWEESLEKI